MLGVRHDTVRRWLSGKGAGAHPGGQRAEAIDAATAEVVAELVQAPKMPSDPAVVIYRGDEDLWAQRPELQPTAPDGGAWWWPGPRPRCRGRDPVGMTAVSLAQMPLSPDQHFPMRRPSADSTDTTPPGRHGPGATRAPPSTCPGRSGGRPHLPGAGGRNQGEGRGVVDAGDARRSSRLPDSWCPASRGSGARDRRRPLVRCQVGLAGRGAPGEQDGGGQDDGGSCVHDRFLP